MRPVTELVASFSCASLRQRGIVDHTPAQISTYHAPLHVVEGLCPQTFGSSSPASELGLEAGAWDPCWDVLEEGEIFDEELSRSDAF